MRFPLYKLRSKRGQREGDMDRFILEQFLAHETMRRQQLQQQLYFDFIRIREQQQERMIYARPSCIVMRNPPGAGAGFIFHPHEVLEVDENEESRRVSSSGKKRPHPPLWQFLKEMLANPRYRTAIRWTDRAEGIFRIDDTALVARKWGEQKRRPDMNYDKMSRGIRQYYKKGIMKKTAKSQRLVYQFCREYAN
ncbi:putative DNA-binding protein D-ETS-4 [Hypsibius exemplaris]|uniref:DNA-binding protein D-ETS-4 n=1 Tax=Hypsibius exemplaris TaxID=2072580 RepID=A0A1W0WHB5_HYPEX|nr:putative DNA-binding protein D-ETS-4 [Hypsibius exemplaris]